MRRSSPPLDQIIVSNPKTLHQKLSITPVIQPNISYRAIYPFSIISQVVQCVDCFVVQIHLLESKDTHAIRTRASIILSKKVYDHP